MQMKLTVSTRKNKSSTETFHIILSSFSRQDVHLSKLIAIFNASNLINVIHATKGFYTKKITL